MITAGQTTITTPSGPYSRSEWLRFANSERVKNLQPGQMVTTTISGGNGVGYPGYYDQTVIARCWTQQEIDEETARRASFRARN